MFAKLFFLSLSVYSLSPHSLSIYVCVCLCDEGTWQSDTCTFMYMCVVRQSDTHTHTHKYRVKILLMIVNINLNFVGHFRSSYGVVDQFEATFKFLSIIFVEKNSSGRRKMVSARKTNLRERLCTINLLNNVTCSATKVNNHFKIKTGHLN